MITWQYGFKTAPQPLQRIGSYLFVEGGVRAVFTKTTKTPLSPPPTSKQYPRSLAVLRGNVRDGAWHVLNLL
jgi:hypothetical protein